MYRPHTGISGNYRKFTVLLTVKFAGVFQRSN
jgi:hypothetical protein